MSNPIPSPFASRPWDELAENERRFFAWDHHVALPRNHAAQIRLLTPTDSNRLCDWVWLTLPSGWPEWREHFFKEEETLMIGECWNDEQGLARVRSWLFDRGIPFQRQVFLIYEDSRVVTTNWKMLIRYWDAFAWSVGYAMIAVDHTLQWAGCFHHEDVIVFGSNIGFREPRKS